MRYADGINVKELPLPNIEEAELPVYGVEPQEMKPELPPMRDYSEKPVSRFTSPTDQTR